VLAVAVAATGVLLNEKGVTPARAARRLPSFRVWSGFSSELGQGVVAAEGGEDSLACSNTVSTSSSSEAGGVRRASGSMLGLWSAAKMFLEGEGGA
jgi:hypothetical protein